jgi:hypothetical protein
MKELIDDTQVPDRGYYYLLDWNEYDRRETILKLFNKNRLCDLELHEYIVSDLKINQFKIMLTIFGFTTKRLFLTIIN